MKIRILISGKGGILDQQTIDVGDDDPAEVSEHIHDALLAWQFAPGDTITITEE